MKSKDKQRYKSDKFYITLLVADIYIRNINCLKSAFAQDTYGVGYSERISAISKRLRSVLAVNGDSYSNNRHKENGTMKIYKPKEFDAQKVIDGRQADEEQNRQSSLQWDLPQTLFHPSCLSSSA